MSVSPQRVISLRTRSAISSYDWYGTGLDRIRAVRPVLGDSRHGAQLDDQILALTATPT